jgi:hypothetical protein
MDAGRIPWAIDFRDNRVSGGDKCWFSGDLDASFVWLVTPSMITALQFREGKIKSRRQAKQKKKILTISNLPACF